MEQFPPYPLAPIQSEQKSNKIQSTLQPSSSIWFSCKFYTTILLPDPHGKQLITNSRWWNPTMKFMLSTIGNSFHFVPWASKFLGDQKSKKIQSILHYNLFHLLGSIADFTPQFCYMINTVNNSLPPDQINSKQLKHLNW